MEADAVKKGYQQSAQEQARHGGQSASVTQHQGSLMLQELNEGERAEGESAEQQPRRAAANQGTHGL